VYFQFTDQLLIGAAPVLVIRIVPPNQLEPWLLTIYWQLADALKENVANKIENKILMGDIKDEAISCEVAPAAADAEWSRYICNS
jgi:hypothetical protein